MKEYVSYFYCRATYAGSVCLRALILLAAFSLQIHPMFAQIDKPIYQSGTYTLWPDRVVEGEHTARAVSRTTIESSYPIAGSVPGTLSRWTLTHDLAKYPQSKSDYPLLDALYNLSLEELQLDTREDGAFNAGAKWQGVWTRDVSYSILLSLAAVQPEAARLSLLHKVKRDRIVQDTGTGGSWPVSSDRVTWALAAWEIYLVTGDRAWLQQSYTIVRNSMLDDEAVVMDPVTGLARGESSFMDWREQTYPRWMEPVDIYESKNLGTNAVYYRTFRILAEMAQQLGQPAQEWDAKAEGLRAAINKHLWQKDRGYYGQYLYGRVWQTLSPRSDALGESLAVLFDIPDSMQQDSILSSQALMPYGIPTVFPETPNIPPYHNRSVWPFVQAFWNLAAAKRGDEAALLHGVAAVDRAAALFLTNKENFVADTGNPVGTEINSDRQLWSVAGNLAMVYRVLYGMEFVTDGLHLHPVIPERLKGTRTLTNFHYREAVLSVTVQGFGKRVRKITLDEKSVPFIPSTLVGSHAVKVEMDNIAMEKRTLHLVESETAPETPTLHIEGSMLTWSPVESASYYQLYKNGALASTTAASSFQLAEGKEFAQYQVTAVSTAGLVSFLSAPVAFGGLSITIDAAAGGNAYATLELSGTSGLMLTGSVPQGGAYSVRFRYANGSGPVNTENKCAIRTLFIDGKQIGPIVLPQRGDNDWSNWGWSNDQVTRLSPGPHQFELRLLPQDANMNGEVNRAWIANIAVTLLP